MKDKNQLFNRYSRQIFIDEIGIEGQRKIMNASILIIGAGGLGSPAISYLAAAGIGVIAIADFDILELHNLNRQIIHSEKDIGKLKVESADHFVSEINSSIEIIKIPEKITKYNVHHIVKGYDIILDGSDNFTTRYVVNDACIVQNKPLVYGSIFAFEGHFAVFNFQGSKNLRDLFPQPPPLDQVTNCDKNGVLGPLPGIIGSMMAMMTLKIICDLPVQFNQLTIVDTLNWQFNQVEF